MYIELAGAYATFLFALFLYAEYFNKPALAVVASVLIFPLGAWILGDGLQMQTGELITASGTNLLDGENHALLSNTTSDSTYNETITLSETREMRRVYEDIPVTPYIPFSELIALICFLLGLYSMFHYALRTMAKT